MAQPCLLWTLLVSTSLGASMAQTVTQPQQEKSVREAESATLDCTYDTSDTSYYLFWYKQQGGRMTLVILQESYRQQNARQNRFSVNFQKAAKSFSLEISDLQLGDTATYFCALMESHSDTGLTGEKTVEQNPLFLSIWEGTNSTIYCNYSSSATDRLSWFRQDPGKSPEFLFVLLWNGAVTSRDRRLTASLDSKAHVSTLHFSGLQHSHAATYLCAVGTQCSPCRCWARPKPAARLLEPSNCICMA